MVFDAPVILHFGEGDGEPPLVNQVY